jgi:hypothetical protein
MPQTLDNGVIVPVNGDAWNLTADLATMGNSIKGITPVANQAARDALVTYSGRCAWRQDLLQFEIWTGSTWIVFDAREQSTSISSFSTGWSATNAAEHQPRVLRTGSMVIVMGACDFTTTAGKNICTVGTEFRPPSNGTRFIGTVTTSTNVTGSLVMTSGVIGFPSSGYGNLPVGGTAGTCPLVGFWSLD